MKLTEALVLAAGLLLAGCQGGMVGYGVSYSTGYPGGYYDPYFVGPSGAPYVSTPWPPYYAPYYARPPRWYGPPRFGRPYGYWSYGAHPRFRHPGSHRYR